MKIRDPEGATTSWFWKVACTNPDCDNKIVARPKPMAEILWNQENQENGWGSFPLGSPEGGPA